MGLHCLVIGPVFVTHTGNRMESRNVSGRLTSIWGKGEEGR